MTRVKVLLAAVVVLAVSAVSCTPEEYQRWWVGQGNQALGEPELSRSAAGATVFWEEVARRARFSHSVSPIDGSLAARMTPSSWRPGCPVALGDLRLVRIAHLDFSGTERTGALIVHHDAVKVVVALFQAMWDDRFPVASMRLVDDFGGDDDASMAANNTSAFNCRTVAGSSRWSEHAYGRAVDINPVQNPYVSGARVEPAAGAAYVDRTNRRPGMLLAGSPAMNVIDFVGWGWGGRWNSFKDYQHVSASGR
ncbi:MAG: M15 family metallopeptidase [Microthrixaceae bacterium]